MRVLKTSTGKCLHHLTHTFVVIKNKLLIEIEIINQHLTGWFGDSSGQIMNGTIQNSAFLYYKKMPPLYFYHYAGEIKLHSI